MIPPRLVLATSNPGKVAELALLLREWGDVDAVSLATFPGVRCPEERETTYVENARAKAEAVAAATALPALADDSGLEVEALGGAPGIRSARWAPTDAARIAKLLAALAGTPAAGRRARFRCAVALAWPAGPTEIAEGECTGVIAEETAGAAGFGYDPIFVSDDLGRTFAAASAEEKDRVSHRARAVRALGARLGVATLRRAAPAC
jgi:XTP/dITP diphosphohydrolase